MTITLDLPQELEKELSAEAARLGLPLSEYALRLLFAGSSTSAERPKNGAELVNYWRKEELIGSRPDITDSQEHARALRRKAETRGRN